MGWEEGGMGSGHPPCAAGSHGLRGTNEPPGKAPWRASAVGGGGCVPSWLEVGSSKCFTRRRAASGSGPHAVAPGQDGCAEREAGGWWGQPFTTHRARGERKGWRGVSRG